MRVRVGKGEWVGVEQGEVCTDAGGDLHYVKNTSSRTANARHAHLNKPRSCDELTLFHTLE